MSGCLSGDCCFPSMCCQAAPLCSTPRLPVPALQLACLDASLAMKPVLGKFQSVIITSGTLSPIELYPRILGFQPVVLQSLKMTLTRWAALLEQQQLGSWSVSAVHVHCELLACGAA